MGKRKHREDEEEYLEWKIRRLERQKSKIRHKRRRRSYSSYSSSPKYTDYEYDDLGYDVVDEDADYLQEDSRNQESQLVDTDVIDLVDVYDVTDTATATAGGLRSVVARAASAAPAPQPGASTATPATSTLPLPPPPAPAPAREPSPVPAPAPAPVQPANDTIEVATLAPPPASVDLVDDLQPDILCLLGDEPVKEEKFGPCIHKDVANRWSDVLVNGLKNEVKKDIIKCYEIPENLKLVQAPLINPEIKAACNENVLKRDNILIEKQKLLATVISSVSNTLSVVLKSDPKDDDYKNLILKSLSDTGRLLCHLHFTETQTRRNFLLANLNKGVKDNIKDLKRDNLLFGKDLPESLKSMKAITKTGEELRPVTTKPKLPPVRNQQAEPSTSKALNWRGQPSPAVRPPPRQTPAKTSSTRGGRRPPPPPPPPPRRATERRAPRAHARTSRR